MSAVFAKDQLHSIIERAENLEAEKKAISDDLRDLYAEAKGNGFDVKALRSVVRLRKQDVDERKEQEAILETYLQALGMLDYELVHTGPGSGGATSARPQACEFASDISVRVASPSFGDAGKALGITASADAAQSRGGTGAAPPRRGRECLPRERPEHRPAPSPEGAPGPRDTSSSPQILTGDEQPRPASPQIERDESKPGGAGELDPDFPPYLRRGPDNRSPFLPPTEEPHATGPP